MKTLGLQQPFAQDSENIAYISSLEKNNTFPIDMNSDAESEVREVNAGPGLRKRCSSVGARTKLGQTGHASRRPDLVTSTGSRQPICTDSLGTWAEVGGMKKSQTNVKSPLCLFLLSFFLSAAPGRRQAFTVY